MTGSDPGLEHLLSVANQPAGRRVSDSSSAGGNEVLGHLEEEVVGLGLADRDPRTLSRERPDDDTGRFTGGRELLGARTKSEPDEVGLGRRHPRPALLAQRRLDPPALLDQGAPP